jgi:hypothetical protein
MPIWYVIDSTFNLIGAGSCVSDCTVLTGNYQSCITCNGFVQCSNGNKYEMPCAATLEWDQNLQACVTSSPTCYTGNYYTIIG